MQQWLKFQGLNRKVIKQDVPPPPSCLHQSTYPLLLSVSDIQSFLVCSHVLQDASVGKETNTRELASDISATQEDTGYL